MKCKTTLLALSSFAFFSLVIISCKKSNSSNNGGTSMTATVNGTAWTNNYPTIGVYAETGGVGQFEFAGLSFKNGDSTELGISFSSPFILGKAISSDTAFVEATYTDSKTGNIYDGGLLGGHAIVTVSSWDSTTHELSATFSGVLYNEFNSNDSVTVTSASFSSGYTE